MSTAKPPREIRTLRVMPIMLLVILLLASSAFGQQTYVTRFDAFRASPFWIARMSAWRNLVSRGRSASGRRPGTRSGLTIASSTGDLSITPTLLPSALQQHWTLQFTQLRAMG